MLLKRLPAEILDEWRGWMAQEMLPRMNPLWSGEVSGDTTGACTFPVYNEWVKLHSVQFAPPAGVMAQNYSRYYHSLDFWATILLTCTWQSYSL
jgi:hypothetical protein